MFKFSSIINYPLRFLGIKLVRTRTLAILNQQSSAADLLDDPEFLKIYQRVSPYLMVSIERCYALYQGVKYIIAKNVPGDFIECGVWKGGSSMLMASTLLSLGITDRKIVLYDTFSGMTEPGEYDGVPEKEQWASQLRTDNGNDWCYAPIGEVKKNMASTGYPAENIEFIKGKVEDTITASGHAGIALLRLDTDWYASTKHELLHLYPQLAEGGVLIIDDYGYWQGARKATDEYFSNTEPRFMNRIDHSGRLIIK